jgi:2-keto-4-pentenoate hydratase/2-oxohepta-3-ene-1,7-dioic acid hydratase in catechol pathway
MKLVRWRTPAGIVPCLVDATDVMRDVSAVVKDFTAPTLGTDLQRLRALDPSDLPVIDAVGRPAIPVDGIRQVIGIGLNYRAHAAEAGLDVPEYPVVFQKAITCLSGACDEIVVPRGCTTVDWEAELGVVIGRLTRRVPRETALDHVAGYCVAHDVSERTWQTKRGGQWGKGKSFDSFGPVGPWLVTADEIADPQSLGILLSVNGTGKQSGSTSDMIFPVAWLVSHLSEFMTLLPGDLIMTGTPAGIGATRQPAEFLRPGDVVEIEITGLGRQRQRVVAAGDA